MDPTHIAAREAIGQAILELRLRGGISQEKLAYRCGLDRSYMGGIERAERNPSLRVLLQVAEGLEMPLSRIVERAEELEARTGDADASV